MEHYIEKTEFIELEMNSSDYTLTFPSNEPLMLGENAEIALKSYMLYYTFPNVCEKYENNKVRVKYNGVWKDITIPDGMYEVHQLSQYINKMTVLNRDILSPGESVPIEAIKFEVDKSTFHCILHLQNGVELDLTVSKLYELLGLEQKIYVASERGQNFINITKNLDKIYIRCNLVERRYQYQLRDVLYSILPIALPGEALMGEIDHPLEFYRCRNRVIREINIRLTNENNELLEFKENIRLKITVKHHVKTE